MKFKGYFLILTIFLLVWSSYQPGQAQIQHKPKRAIQLSGLVVTGDSLAAVPYSSVWVKNSRRGTITDFYGFFSIAVYELDTVRFSSVGYKEVSFVVPDTLSLSRYSVVQIMSPDTIYLPETVIYPWPTRDQFKYAFLNVEIPENDFDRAMRNLERAEIRDRSYSMPMDGAMTYRQSMNQFANRLYYAGQAPPMRIFDPFAWAQFFKAWREGKFKKD
jgi:hypothetical protein